MVRGLGFGAFLFVDGDGFQAFGGSGGEQMVVDAQAGVSVPGAGLIVPEGVEGFGGVEGAEGVGEAGIDEGVEGVSGFGADQGVIGGQGAGGEIGVGGADIVIAGEDEILVGVEECFGVGAQAVHPFQLIGVAGVAAGIAVGEV